MFVSDFSKNGFALVITLLVCVSLSSVDAQRLQFDSYGRNDGLASNMIGAIYQDSEGYIWVAAKDVLHRFDGTEFKSYEQTRDGFRRQTITIICEDKAGNLWFAAGGSLYLYNKRTDTFDRYIPKGVGIQQDLGAYAEYIYEIDAYDHDLLLLSSRGGAIWVDTKENTWKPATFTNDGLVSIYRRHPNSIWYWPWRGDLSILDSTFQEKQRFVRSPDTPHAIPEFMHAVFETQDSTVWIIGSDIVYATPDDLNNNKFTSLLGAHDSKAGIFRSYAINKEGNFWVGNDRGQLLFIDYLKKEVTYKQPVKTGEASGINALLIDAQGVLWVGLERGGLKKSTLAFPGIRQVDPVASSFSTRIVSQFAEDQNGNIWVGTDGSGLSRFNPETDKVDCYLTSENSPLASDAVIEVFATSDNRFVVGTYPTGVYELFPETCTLQAIDELAAYRISDLYEDEHGMLWFAQLKGLLSFRLEDLNITKYPTPDTYNEIHDLHLVRWNDFLIISSWFDVSIFDLETNEFLPEQWLYSPTPSKLTLPHEKVYMSVVDQENMLWLGTDQGLVRYSESKQAFDVYFREAGLPGLSIRGMVVGDSGDLWLSTDNGIAQFDTEQRKVIRTYTPDEGLQGFEFNRASAFKDRKGRLYFGGYEGFNVIEPHRINEPREIPSGRSVITAVYASRQKKAKHAEYQQTEEEETTKVRIDTLARAVVEDSVSFRSVRFAFANLDYVSPSNNSFEYRLVGNHEEWYRTEASTITYPMLGPGTYRFEVRGINALGNLSTNVASYAFVVAPFWYETRWFFLMMIALGLGSIALLYGWRVREVRARNERLKQLVDEQTREIREKNASLKEVNQKVEEKNISLAAAYEEAQWINDSLIETNTSLENRTDQLREALEANKEILSVTAHDLKNPLGGIIGLAEMVLEDLNDGFQTAYDSAADNIPLLKQEAERMLQIIQELLDTHRAGEQRDLRKEKTILGDIVSSAVRWNIKQAEAKGIILHYAARETIIVDIDVMSIQRALDNYVSNAIKYSPRDSNVWITVDKVLLTEQVPTVKVSVKDEGPGLTEEDLTKVFGKMQQLSAKPTAGEHSTGLGLFIVKKLVEAHGGQVGVHSVPGEGATFWFTLPVCEIEEELVTS